MLLTWLRLGQRRMSRTVAAGQHARRARRTRAVGQPRGVGRKLAVETGGESSGSGAGFRVLATAAAAAASSSRSTNVSATPGSSYSPRSDSKSWHFPHTSPEPTRPQCRQRVGLRSSSSPGSLRPRSATGKHAQRPQTALGASCGTASPQWRQWRVALIAYLLPRVRARAGAAAGSRRSRGLCPGGNPRSRRSHPPRRRPTACGSYAGPSRCGRP